MFIFSPYLVCAFGQIIIGNLQAEIYAWNVFTDNGPYSKVTKDKVRQGDLTVSEPVRWSQMSGFTARPS
jgi:hypothetical protein